MTLAEKRTLIKEACILIKQASQEHPTWGAPLNYAVYLLVLHFKLPKKDQPWLIKAKKKRAAKRTKKKETK